MISKAVFLGSKKFGLNLFNALYNANQSITWTILCPPDQNDLRTHFSEFQGFSKLNNINFLIVKLPEMVTQYSKNAATLIVSYPF